MPPFDREAALKAAEKALKLGKVDAAIAEYVKVVEAQPRDWNSANALGDLYVRAKQIDKGLEQYTRIADHLAEEGFYPKAAALFKKILKLKPDRRIRAAAVGRPRREAGHARRRQAVLPAGRRAAQGARRQEGRGRNRDSPRHARSRRSRRAHARRRSSPPRWATRRRRCASSGRRGAARRSRTSTPRRSCRCRWPTTSTSRTKASAAGCSPPISASNPDAGARASPSGADELKQIAAALEKAGQHRCGARRARRRSPRADPSDLEVRAGLALAYVARGDLDKARTYLSRGNRRHQSGAVADARRDGAARATAWPKARRRSCRR